MGLFSSPSFSSCLRRAVRWSYRGAWKAPAADPIARDAHKRAVRAAVSVVFPSATSSRPAAVKRNGGLRGSTATRAKGQRL